MNSLVRMVVLFRTWTDQLLAFYNVHWKFIIFYEQPNQRRVFDFSCIALGGIMCEIFSYQTSFLKKASNLGKRQI